MLKLENRFYKIIELTNNIDSIIDKLKNYNIYLKKLYEKILSENTNSPELTTDTFALQNNIFELKIKHNIIIYSKVSNYIYGDYYKLLKHIIEHINNFINDIDNNIIDENIINSISIIDKIEPFKLNNGADIYNIKSSKKLNDAINNIIEILNKTYKKTEYYIQSKIKTLNPGLNIENYIETIKYNNNLLNQHIQLFIKFYTKYQSYHIKYLTYLESDIENIYNNILSEINFKNDNNDDNNDNNDNNDNDDNLYKYGTDENNNNTNSYHCNSYYGVNIYNINNCINKYLTHISTKILKIYNIYITDLKNSPLELYFYVGRFCIFNIYMTFLLSIYFIYFN